MLKVVRRRDTGALTISGTVRLPDGSRARVRRRAGSDRIELAREEAAAIEAEILRTAWHGQRRSARRFAEAVTSYLQARQRTEGTRALLHRILIAIGDVGLGEVDQAALDRARIRMLRPGAADSTIVRNLVVPVRAVLLHAARRGWCEAPHFELPRQPEGRTRRLLPEEAERLLAAAAPHVQPLLLFLLGTGARMSEALELDWRDVDLRGGRAILWRTKNGRRRIVTLPPRLVVALASLPHREDAVFRWETKRPTGHRDGQPKRRVAYADRGRLGGGQIKTAWRGALKRAGLDPELTPHDLRHTWASWHYALHRDLLALRIDGQWSSIALVERYAHLLPAGHETQIRIFWHEPDTATDAETASA
jgi:integrase